MTESNRQVKEKGKGCCTAKALRTRRRLVVEYEVYHGDAEDTEITEVIRVFLFSGLI